MIDKWRRGKPSPLGNLCLGTKGAGSAAKGSKTASNVTNAAKQSVQNTASKAPNVQTLYLNPFGLQHQLAPVGPVPYNVVDGVNLRDQMMMSAKKFSDDGKDSHRSKGTG